MTDFTNKDKFKFYHISRHAEIVVIKDRDVLAFIPECVSQDASVGIKIYRDQAQTFKVYESSPQVTINATERVLLWARTRAGMPVSSMIFAIVNVLPEPVTPSKVCCG